VPTDVAVIERAIRLADIEMHAVALQRRRLATSEPEDEEFLFRWWTDLQFFILALARLRRYAQVALAAPSAADHVQAALAVFDRAVPGLRLMRNIGEHGDEYALNRSRRREKSIGSRQLEVGLWNGQTYQWLGTELNVDEALEAAKALFAALRSLRPSVST
jgi:hypothetical protein